MHKAMLNVVAKSPEEFKSSLEKKFDDKIHNVEVRGRVAGKQDEVSFYDVWISCRKDDLEELVEFLFHSISPSSMSCRGTTLGMLCC